MQPIEGVLLEPVGCLADFPSEPFLEIAARVFGRRKKPARSASRAYWHLLNLMEQSGKILDTSEAQVVDALEVEAAGSASVYEDVAPALAELQAMHVHLILTSSLSSAALARFLKHSSLSEFFDAVWSRDSAGGIKVLPIQRAIVEAGLNFQNAVFLTDTGEGLKVAQSAGINAVLMMNDPDEARRLALRGPAGGIVSLHELQDFIRLLRASPSQIRSIP